MSVLDQLLRPIPKHPVGMVTDYRTVAVLHYAVDPVVLRRSIPHALEVDLHRGRGFVSVVCADMVRMRPAPLPRLAGITYDQVVYRVPVRYRGVPGLFFLGSDAANVPMVAAGAAFSMFKVRRSPTRITDAGDRVTIDVFGGRRHVDLHAYLKVEPRSDGLPSGSVFPNIGTATAFLIDRFEAFIPDPVDDRMHRVRVARGTWDVIVPSLTDIRSDILDGSPAFPAGSAALDHVVVARNIPYRWYARETEADPGTWRPARWSVPA
jgi:uncharacterized protein YqjF (DUF2071 family)